MTIDLTTQQPMPSSPRRRDGHAPLPVPAERAGLRLAWRLTEEQVAEAFGVTAATVRSWEAGRSAPRGLRRAAYAAFLSGLAHGLVPGPSDGDGLPPVGRPAPRAPHRRRALPSPAPAPAPAPGRLPASRPDGGGTVAIGTPVLPGWAPSAPGRPVGPRPDPVPIARLRRFRIMTAAVGAWIAFGHLVATMPPPHP